MQIHGANLWAAKTDWKGVFKPVMVSQPEAVQNASKTKPVEPNPQAQSKSLDSNPKIEGTKNSTRSVPSLFDRFQKAFGTMEGDENFQTQFDFDRDGEIGPSDMTLLQRMTELDRPTLTFEALQKAFGSMKGDDLYDARYDLDQNGEIGPADFTLFSNRTANADFGFEALQAAFGSSHGEANYNALADLDKDGEVGASDFTLYQRYIQAKG